MEIAEVAKPITISNVLEERSASELLNAARFVYIDHSLRKNTM
jgi:hypothetical protein